VTILIAAIASVFMGLLLIHGPHSRVWETAVSRHSVAIEQKQIELTYENVKELSPH